LLWQTEFALQYRFNEGVQSMKKRERCPGSKHPVLGADEPPTNFVSCYYCHNNYLLVVATRDENGVKHFAVPVHDRPVPKKPRHKRLPQDRSRYQGRSRGR
jgi:hypothetical protein